MIVHKYVSEYIELFETGTVVLNKERIMLINYCNYSASSNKKTGQIHVSDSKT
ncbi:hypothetical protein [Bacillus cereus]|uniref:hypothetical protein n=1 Tax=Bacillus cereus TaxID=1396 RepID=UPI001591FEAA|nr:hypothetical protein [Bacillus cereus]